MTEGAMFTDAKSFASAEEEKFRELGGTFAYDSPDTLAQTEEEASVEAYTGEPEADVSAAANPYPFIRGLVDVRGQLQRNGNGGPWTRRALSTKTGGVIYHFAGPAQNRSISALDRLKSYATYHCRLNGFGAGATGNGLMYHIGIAEDGTKYLCFDIEYDRWHCAAWPYNGTALAINLPIGIGQTPTEAQYRAAREVADDWLKARAQTRAQVRGHKEVGPSNCPDAIIMNGLVYPMRQGKNPGGSTPAPTNPVTPPQPGAPTQVEYQTVAGGEPTGTYRNLGESKDGALWQVAQDLKKYSSVQIVKKSAGK